MNKVILKWSPAVPIPNKDNIISSGAKANNEKGFTPSYDTEGRPNMYFLLNNEYMRMWFKERGKYEKEVYTKKEMMKEESKIKRRYVQRDLRRKEKKKDVPIIKLKRFQKVPSRTENRQDPKLLEEMKSSEEQAAKKEDKRTDGGAQLPGRKVEKEGRQGGGDVPLLQMHNEGGKGTPGKDDTETPKEQKTYESYI